MKNFDSLEQRIVNMYIDLFPGFKPDENCNVSKEVQKEFYSFMKFFISMLYENPSLLFAKINPDDFFVIRFNKNSENKKKLYNDMRKIAKSLEDLFAFLFDVGNIGVLTNNKLAVEKGYKIPKRYLNILEKCGVLYSKDDASHYFSHDKNNEIIHCWKWLSTKSGVTLPHFFSCMFDNNYSYTSEIYSKLSGNEEAFQKLETFLIENNYYRIDNRGNKITLDYIKKYNHKDNEIKDAWAGKTHGGISAQYDGFMQNPPLFSLRVPYYKNLLQQSEKIDRKVKEFIVTVGKKCDDCRFCVQMDKSGERELAYIKVTTDTELKMCTYFPGFQYCWEHLDHNTVDNIIEFLRYADKTLRENN